jgi:hypothetical protein
MSSFNDWVAAHLVETGSGKAVRVVPPVPEETDEEFLANLKRLAHDFHWTDRFIGLVVRHRWPKKDAGSEKTVEPYELEKVPIPSITYRDRPTYPVKEEK